MEDKNDLNSNNVVLPLNNINQNTFKKKLDIQKQDLIWENTNQVPL